MKRQYKLSEYIDSSNLDIYLRKLKRLRSILSAIVSFKFMSLIIMLNHIERSFSFDCGSVGSLQKSSKCSNFLAQTKYSQFAAQNIPQNCALSSSSLRIVIITHILFWFWICICSDGLFLCCHWSDLLYLHFVLVL